MCERGYQVVDRNVTFVLRAVVFYNGADRTQARQWRIKIYRPFRVSFFQES